MKRNIPRQRLVHKLVLLLPAIILAGLTVILSSTGVFATRNAQTATTTPQPKSDEESTPSLLSIGNDTCLECHGKSGLTLSLENGDSLGLYVPLEEFNRSIHGTSGYACVQCHTNVGNYPHPPFSAESSRDATLKLNPACERCHAYQYELAQDSVHAAAMAGGMLDAAVCTDCHSAHAVRQLTDPETHKLLADARVWIPQTCAKCHNAIYQKYLTSVHGSALVDENNLDVPTCIDCHGVHNIEDPTTATFRLKSPQICARCHTDPKIMNKYGISTNVLNTYVADFHGSTVVLFEKQSPDAETNKPVCYDCHGVHDIRRTDDPQKGLQVRENLLARCQVCHPNATTNFPTAWLSHYIPSPEKYPIVYYVDLFYKIFIPGVLGGMAILVLFDINKKFRTEFNRELFVERFRTYLAKPITLSKMKLNLPSKKVKAAPDSEPSTQAKPKQKLTKIPARDAKHEDEEASHG